MVSTTEREKVIKKVKDMVQGANVGNIQSPTAEEEFRIFIKNWMESLPNKGKTEFEGLDGQIYTIDQILESTKLRENFRKAFDTARLDRLADSAKKKKQT